MSWIKDSAKRARHNLSRLSGKIAVIRKTKTTTQTKGSLMALYKITIKRSMTLRGVRLEKGMSVDVPCIHDPVSFSGGKIASDAFQRTYGIDLKKIGAANKSYLDVVKLN